MSKILKGVLNYRQNLKAPMIKQLNQLQEAPSPPKAVFFSCIDSRLQPSAFTSTSPGDMFIVRNAGNMVPHTSKLGGQVVSNEAAALDLGCGICGVRHVVVCGHSDCKAIHLLLSLRDYLIENKTASDGNLPDKSSPLRAWIEDNGVATLLRYKELEKTSFQEPMSVRISGDATETPAVIDSAAILDESDRLSQINTLVQLENVASYPFISDLLIEGKVKIHAFWFDVRSADVLYFSKNRSRFEVIHEDNAHTFSDELD